MSGFSEKTKDICAVTFFLFALVVIGLGVKAVVTTKNLSDIDPFQFVYKKLPREIETNDGRKFVFYRDDVSCVNADVKDYQGYSQLAIDCTVKGYVVDLLGNKEFHYDAMNGGSGYRCAGIYSNYNSDRLACIAARSSGYLE